MTNSNRDVASFVILASAARGDTNSVDQDNVGYAGGIFTFDLTATATTLALPTYKVQGRVPGTTKYYTLGSIATTSTEGVSRIVVFPGVSTANASTVGVVGQEFVSQPLPRTFRVATTNATTEMVTFSVGVDLIG